MGAHGTPSSSVDQNPEPAQVADSPSANRASSQVEEVEVIAAGTDDQMIDEAQTSGDTDNLIEPDTYLNENHVTIPRNHMRQLLVCGQKRAHICSQQKWFQQKLRRNHSTQLQRRQSLKHQPYCTRWCTIAPKSTDTQDEGFSYNCWGPSCCCGDKEDYLSFRGLGNLVVA